MAPDLAVHGIGSGEPVLLIPAHRFECLGLPEFDVLIEGLTALGRQVITYDPPGSGSSPGPEPPGDEPVAPDRPERSA